MDEEGGIQPEPVMAEDGDTGGVLGQAAESGERIARVDHGGPRSGDAVDERRRRGGDAGQELQEIEGGPFRRQQAVRLSRYSGQRRSLLGARAVGREDFDGAAGLDLAKDARSEEHTSELQSLMRISYAVFCLKKQTKTHRDE